MLSDACVGGGEVGAGAQMQTCVAGDTETELCWIAFPQPHPGNVGFPQPHPGNVGVRKPGPLGHFSIELVVKVCHDVCGYLCRLLHQPLGVPLLLCEVHNHIVARVAWHIVATNLLLEHLHF